MSGIGRTQPRLHILLAQGFACRLYMIQKLLGNIYSNDFPFRTNFFRKQAGEQASAGSNVRNSLARLDLTGFDNLLTLRKNLPAFHFKLLDKILWVRILKRIVDTWLDAFLLRRDR